MDSSQNDTKEIESKNWLTAHENTLADLHSISQCMCLSDVTGENENCLVVADLTDHRCRNKQMKLKVYKGLELIKDTNIIDLPTGVESFFLDQNEPRTPAIAVASGPYIYVYKNMKPYYKFTLPLLEVNVMEDELWKHYNSEKISTKELAQQLESLRNQGINLTVRSNKLISISEDKMDEFCSVYASQPLKKQTVATCLTTMKKSHNEADAISCLVVGTEAGQVLVIDPEAFTVLYAINLDSTPVFLSTIGLYDVEFRIYIACRNGSIYVGKRGSPGPRKLIYLNTQPVGMIRIGKILMVACMDESLRCISPKGKELWKKQLPASIITVCPFESDQHNISGILVSLSNGLVQLYRDKDLIETMASEYDIVTGLLFGPFGREQFALLMVTRTGCLIIKLLKRNAKLEPIENNSSVTLNKDKKLAIPKKTKLFIDQAFKERENAVDVHRKFMQDLANLRLITARNYLELLQTRQNPISTKKSDNIMFSIEVNGIGPVFRMKIYLKNTSQNIPVTDLNLVFVYDHKIYSIEQPLIQVPFLVPGISYPYSVFVECINDKGIADTIRVIIFKSSESEPIVTGVVNMPVSETIFSS